MKKLNFSLNITPLNVTLAIFLSSILIATPFIRSAEAASNTANKEVVLKLWKMVELDSL